MSNFEDLIAGLRDLNRLVGAGATAAHKHGYYNDQERGDNRHRQGYRPVASDHRLEQLNNLWAKDNSEHRQQREARQPTGKDGDTKPYPAHFSNTGAEHKQLERRRGGNMEGMISAHMP